MKRRHALAATLALVLASLAALGHAAPAAKTPNILFILADNWRWPNAGVLGDPHAITPTFDRLAREGVLFTHVFNPVPSCTPTRSCLLTGRIAHQLGERASLWSGFPRDTPVVTDLLRGAGYALGHAGKGWAPGNFEASGWKENPAGPKFESFPQFLSRRDPRAPFFFWLGNTDTATRGGRLPFLEDARQQLDPAKLTVPALLPDVPEVRQDLMNYYGGVIRLDREASAAVAALEAAGLLEDTVIVYGSDNGWQLPRGLGNCYDDGSRVPLVIRWGKHFPAGRRVDAFVNVADLGPTFLELAGVSPPREMSMHSLLPLLRGQPDPTPRDAVFLERERHANVRHDNQSYPVRAIRTREFLYLRNLRPDRWPAGDPDVLYVHERPFGDVDTTRIKDVLLAHRDDPAFAPAISRIFGKRPAEELYDLRRDPDQLTNVAADPAYATTLRELRGRVDRWMRETGDPRVDPAYDGFDAFPYHGKPSKARD